MAVTDEAILRIKAMLMSGELRPGDRLPPEKELGDKLGLSRSSLREAVKALELVRVLDVRHGAGTYVTSLEPRLLLEAMSFVADIQRDESVLEIFEVRRILEPAAAAMACLRVTEADVDELRAMVASVAPDTDVEGLVEHDLDFHRRICEHSGNTYLSSLLDTMASSTLRARIWRGLTEDNAAERVLAEHSRIVDALAAADPELTRSVVVVHVNGVMRWLQQAGAALRAPDQPRNGAETGTSGL